MKTTMQLLGARIKELRKARGLSQADLSERLEIAEKYLSRIEVGTNYPSLLVLEKMALVFGTDLKDLFDFEYLREGSAILADFQKLLEETDEEKIRLAYKIVRAVTR